VFPEAIRGTGVGNDIRSKRELFCLDIAWRMGLYLAFRCFGRLRYPGVRELCDVHFNILYQRIGSGSHSHIVVR